MVEQPLPPPGDHEVFVRTVVSGISHGTEIAWFKGVAAALHCRWDPDRRCYIDGPGRSFPVSPGYESVGRIVEIGSAVTSVRVGDLVAIDAPHSDRHVLGEAAAFGGLVPAGAVPEQAIFFVIARVALGAVHDAALSLGETVVVYGLGVVGLLTAQMARLAGATVIGVDRYSLRTKTADSLGITTVLAEPDVDVAVKVRDLIGNPGADAAIEASGSYAGLHEAIRCLRIGGRVVTVASYHDDQLGLRLGEEYHRNRITLISSMTVNQCPQRGYPAWTLDRLNSVARELIVSKGIRTDNLITHRVPFSRAADAYALINESPQDTIKVVLTYEK